MVSGARGARSGMRTHTGKLGSVGRGDVGAERLSSRPTSPLAAGAVDRAGVSHPLFITPTIAVDVNIEAIASAASSKGSGGRVGRIGGIAGEATLVWEFCSERCSL